MGGLMKGMDKNAFLGAVKTGVSGKAALLLKKHPDFAKIYDNDGGTPLHIAAEQGHSDIVELLLSNGADVKLQDSMKRSPLHYAANGKTTRLLISHGDNPAGKDVADWTPLHHAARNGYKDVIEALIEAGADVNIQNESGETSLHYAVGNGHTDIARILLENKASPDIQDTEDGETPLHYAVVAGNKEMLELLLSFNADPDVKERKTGRTPLIYADMRGMHDVANLLRQYVKKYQADNEE